MMKVNWNVEVSVVPKKGSGEMRSRRIHRSEVILRDVRGRQYENDEERSSLASEERKCDCQSSASEVMYL